VKFSADEEFQASMRHEFRHKPRSKRKRDEAKLDTLVRVAATWPQSPLGSSSGAVRVRLAKVFAYAQEHSTA
jgi:hypothetical protein